MKRKLVQASNAGQKSLECGNKVQVTARGHTNSNKSLLLAEKGERGQPEEWGDSGPFRLFYFSGRS